jgi:hypothetical protein
MVALPWWRHSWPNDYLMFGRYYAWELFHGGVLASSTRLARAMRISTLKMDQWFDGCDGFWSEEKDARQGSAKPVTCSCFCHRVTPRCPRFPIGGVLVYVFRVEALTTCYFTHCQVSRYWVNSTFYSLKSTLYHFLPNLTKNSHNYPI